ncbi:MAG: M56 family metallopeptidase [Ruminococcaceae bacterium]|nr:M56 family metallopeptidase [Oscillospiraceae bacterium]
MNLLQMSFYGAVLILVITALRAVTINKLPKKTFLILWGIAMVRLLIPYELPSALSVYSLIGSDTPAAAVEETEAYYENYSPVSPAVSFEPSEKIMPSEPFAPSAPKTQMPPLSSENSGFGSVWFVIWISGSILLAAFFTVSYLRCYFEFKTSLPVENEFTRQWLIEHKIKRPLSIRQSDKITVPLTYGIFRPVILMPKQTDWENTKRLRYVLLHEYVHVCRIDAFLKLICVFVLCLHWFNPAVWLMYALFNRDIELACDECVVKKSGLNIKAEYALMLIGTEEKKAGLMPLCSGFGKNCAKERIVAVMKIKKMSALAVAAAVILTAGVTMTFATSALNFQEDKPHTADADFSDNEIEKMLALKFEGYEKMSVSEFQNKVWELTDTKEYRDLFERFSVSEALYETRDEDEAAYFIYNILFPLTRDNWRENRFDRCTVSNYEGTSDSAILEYTITLTIQNAYTLTVGEYDTARLNMISGISEFIWDCTPEQLQNEEFMREAIGLKFESLIQFLMKWFASDKLKISANFSYNPLVNLPAQASVNPLLEGSETRRYPNGSEEDYRSLLKLKTTDYQSMSLKDFNLSLLEWADEDHERSERIDEDTRYNDFSVDLNADELSFITLSVYLSGSENAKYVESVYTGRSEEDPSHSLQLPSKTAEKNGFAAWCDLYCEFSYRISDKETVTVGERDRCINGMINGIKEFWDNADIEDLLKITKSDIVKKLNELAAKYSNDKITVTVSEDRVRFERMDERGTANRETAVSENLADPKMYEVYKPFGLTVNQADSKLYYNGKLVRRFDDRISTGFFGIKAIGYYEENGIVDVCAVRENSRLIGLEILSDEEADIKENLSGNENGGTSMFDIYLEYGLEYNKAQNALFYGDKRVRLFWDSLSSDSKPSASESPFISTVSNWDEKGTVDLYVVRDYRQKDKNGYGKITGLRIADQQEFENNTSIFSDRNETAEYA